MKDTIKIFTYLTLLVFIVSLIIYGSWHLKRTINYKWSYQSQVQSEIQKAIVPLNKKIDGLELELLLLQAEFYNLKTNSIIMPIDE